MSQWIYEPKEYLLSQNTQSCTEPIDKKVRQECVQIIFAVGCRIGLPQTTISTASLFFHRFFMREPYSLYNLFDVALACLFVAGKSEDSPKRCSAIARAAVELLLEMDTGMKVKEEMEKLIKKEILSIENCLLKQLCFDFDVQLAYPYILKWGMVARMQREDILKAWYLANGVYFGVECLFFDGECIAAACLRKTVGDFDFLKEMSCTFHKRKEIEELSEKLQ